MASIADIKAIAYDVCGIVRTVTAGQKAKVILLSVSVFLRLNFPCIFGFE